MNMFAVAGRRTSHLRTPNVLGIILMSLRVVLIAHVAAILTQAVLAGQFLSGVDSAVVVHEFTGWLVAGICLVQIGLAMFARASLWFVIGSVCVLFGEALQLGTGYGRYLAVHIPLAVFVFGGVLSQLVWTFSSSFNLGRSYR